jgi:RHS repeat-associated protein
MLTTYGTSDTNCFVGYDGNGNAMALVSAATEEVEARYEYSPFGELIRATGQMAKANPFRFSTKFADDETGLVYYGYRYYSPSQGRWVGREPSLDQVFLHLYLFCGNKPLQMVDPDGRMALDPTHVWKLVEEAYSMAQYFKKLGQMEKAAEFLKDYERLKQIYMVIGRAGGASGGFVTVGAVGTVGLCFTSATAGWVLGRIAGESISWGGKTLDDHLTDFFYDAFFSDGED